MGHFVIKCRAHEKVVSQCRCPGPNKAVRWVDECNHIGPPIPPPIPVHGGEPLFRVYERLETSSRVELTEDNIASVAKSLGWVVDYSGGAPVIRDPSDFASSRSVGDWIADDGTRIHVDEREWLPAGTYQRRDGD